MATPIPVGDGVNGWGSAKEANTPEPAPAVLSLLACVRVVEPASKAAGLALARGGVVRSLCDGFGSVLPEAAQGFVNTCPRLTRKDTLSSVIDASGLAVRAFIKGGAIGRGFGVLVFSGTGVRLIIDTEVRTFRVTTVVRPNKVHLVARRQVSRDEQAFLSGGLR